MLSFRWWLVASNPTPRPFQHTPHDSPSPSSSGCPLKSTRVVMVFSSLLVCHARAQVHLTEHSETDNCPNGLVAEPRRASEAKPFGRLQRRVVPRSHRDGHRLLIAFVSGCPTRSQYTHKTRSTDSRKIGSSVLNALNAIAA